MHEPLIPINRPNKVHERKLKNGIVNMQKYIIKFSLTITSEVKKQNKRLSAKNRNNSYFNLKTLTINKIHKYEVRTQKIATDLCEMLILNIRV